MIHFLRQFQRAVWQALAHDVLNTAKASAYSGMLMLFPALLVITTVLAQVPEGTTLVGRISRSFRPVFCPPTRSRCSSPRLKPAASTPPSWSSPPSPSASLPPSASCCRSWRVFRRAYRLPRDDWGFWKRRLQALLLMPIVLVPLSLATVVIVFGHQFELWMVDNAGHEMRAIVLFFWRMVRWAIAFGTGITVPRRTLSLRHKTQGTLGLGHPRRTRCHLPLFPRHPGLWMVCDPHRRPTPCFMARSAPASPPWSWLYITSFSALLGAELNGRPVSGAASPDLRRFRLGFFQSVIVLTDQKGGRHA